MGTHSLVPPSLFDSTMGLIDLTYPLSEDDKSIWPGNQPFRKSTVSEGADNPMDCFIAHYNISMSEHVGTHIDAPFHFNPNGWTTDAIPLEVLVDVPAVVVDISDKAAKDPQAKVESEDLDAWVSQHGPLPSKCLVLMRSGWGKFYNSDPPTFLGGANATEETLNYPGFGTTGIDWLVKNSDFVGIGVDSLSIELGRTQACYVHRTLTGGNRYGLECLANLDLLPPRGFSVTTLPLNIARVYTKFDSRITSSDLRIACSHPF